jgi:hypothetical protein
MLIIHTIQRGKRIEIRRLHSEFSGSSKYVKIREVIRQKTLTN